MLVVSSIVLPLEGRLSLPDWYHNWRRTQQHQPGSNEGPMNHQVTSLEVEDGFHSDFLVWHRRRQPGSPEALMNLRMSISELTMISFGWMTQ